MPPAPKHKHTAVADAEPSAAPSSCTGGHRSSGCCSNTVYSCRPRHARRVLGVARTNETETRPYCRPRQPASGWLRWWSGAPAPGVMRRWQQARVCSLTAGNSPRRRARFEAVSATEAPRRTLQAHGGTCIGFGAATACISVHDSQCNMHAHVGASSIWE